MGGEWWKLKGFGPNLGSLGPDLRGLSTNLGSFLGRELGDSRENLAILRGWVWGFRRKFGSLGLQGEIGGI